MESEEIIGKEDENEGWCIESYSLLDAPIVITYAAMVLDEKLSSDELKFLQILRYLQARKR